MLLLRTLLDGLGGRFDGALEGLAPTPWPAEPECPCEDAMNLAEGARGLLALLELIPDDVPTTLHNLNLKQRFNCVAYEGRSFTYLMGPFRKEVSMFFDRPPMPWRCVCSIYFCRLIDELRF